MIELTDITGTLGEWLDSNIDPEVPEIVIKTLELAYHVAVAELENNSFASKDISI